MAAVLTKLGADDAAGCRPPRRRARARLRRRSGPAAHAAGPDRSSLLARAEVDDRDDQVADARSDGDVVVAAERADQERVERRIAAGDARLRRQPGDRDGRAGGASR